MTCSLVRFWVSGIYTLIRDWKEVKKGERISEVSG
jgi:hypothetical protein